MRTVCLLYGCQCNACCDRIERALRRVKGVGSVELNLYKATATVEHDESCLCDDLIAAIERIGFLAEIHATDHKCVHHDPGAMSEPKSPE
ncbi:MAG: heavy-metal-associated domain-containing protein [Phycisphaerales bacterium]|nr:heavy-metal-associated domain-containing protein [Phycisphaerales bacterium]